MPMTPREMISLLKKNGFEQVSQNGSHAKFKNPDTGKQTIVPLHCKAMKKGLEQAILKQAGLIYALALSSLSKGAYIM